MSVKAVVLLSGGLDSSTVCACAASERRELYAITFDYHQKHRVEVEAARQTAQLWAVREHLVFPVDLSLFGGSSLVDPNIDVDKSTALSEIGQKIPTSYVPARNTIFLSLALGFAETRGASEIWIGVNHLDYSGYPDCRPEYLKTFEVLANLATKAGVEGSCHFSVRAPLLHKTKGEIIKLGLKLGVDYSKTRTCYSPSEDGRACGTCESCLLRLTGFREAGIPDPAPYIEYK